MAPRIGATGLPGDIDMTRDHNETAWSSLERVTFRVAFVFFALLILPLDWHFWRQVHPSLFLHWQQWFHLTAYLPAFLAVPKWGLRSYGNLMLLLALAVAGGAIWTAVDRERREYDGLYSWLRAAVRYRLALAALGYGVMKLFAIQFPHPTLSELNTDYGDFLQWKIYYLTMGVAKDFYQQSLGLFEVAGAVLLLWRRSATVGASLLAALLLNIFPANVAYQLGDHVYAFTVLLMALAVMAHDGPRLLRLLVMERPVKAEREIPLASAARLAMYRGAALAVCAVFAAIYIGEAALAARSLGNFYPGTPGLSNAAGLYNVKEFSFAGKPLPYSPDDPNRWQDVVFEPWNTLSVHVARPVTIDVANPAIEYLSDDERDYEIAGNAGRHFYRYTQDAAKQEIHLTGKNDSQSFTFTYRYASDGTIELAGTDGNGVPVQMVLEKIDKRYLLFAGRRKPVSIY
jgi:hypothetical protein